MNPLRRAPVVVLAVLIGPAASAHGPIHDQLAAVTAEIEVDPANATLYLRRGKLHADDGDWGAALADYDRAARLGSALLVVDLARGETLLRARRYPEAKEALDAFLARDPEHPAALATRARVLVMLGRSRDAAIDYGRAIVSEEKLGPPEPEHYLERARALAAARAIDLALQGLDEGIRKLGPIVSLQLPAVELELSAGHYDAALARLETVAAQSERREGWLVRRGEILERAGRAPEARRAYGQALAAIQGLRRRTPATEEFEAQARAALARLGAEVRKEGAP